jgi:peptidoglycan/LPS O-acetylase OafA/YrhL
LIHRILSSLTLRALGITSYSLYLLHIIVRDKLLELGVGLGNELFLLTLAVSYLLACVLYALVERPFMRVQTNASRS